MRLTKKIKVVIGVDNKGIEDAREVIAISDKKLAEEKLFALEDIEEELGVDLITLFKAYTNGFYVKGENGKQYIDFQNLMNGCALKNREIFYGHKWSYQYVKLYDYGKTWALTKEKLL